MIKSKKIIYAISILFAFCTASAKTQEPNIDQRISVNLGGSITITLDSPNHDTRMWNLQKPVDKKYLRENKVDRTGDKEVWIFDTLKRGSTIIYMEYASKTNRLQDKNVTPYVIEVEIK